ncbi:S-adenosyl-L-methionine-dependent methyltransferase [Dunaliella salina]|uniref:S-adenosyl-L-methionine-dependent methyltransferase n=1 Tax=Dunaliella salina TaxID=3046 RepID=A0ABQ7G3B5_DUNSA|nr:S-adenosyl-L-methionine-dependent methyltransferase [Dunaliella salina]|eukprot:KAF5829098.1 S-adenosyl-L-methionine-dependent methyltransferase [Dunaliella salina]
MLRKAIALIVVIVCVVLTGLRNVPAPHILVTAFLSIVILISILSRLLLLEPTRERLQWDIGRLSRVLNLKCFFESKYLPSHVCHYYASTTSRDYKLLEWATNCDAMHTELSPRDRLPYNCGHLYQLLHVVACINPKSSSVLEIGVGKGSNAIFLAKVFQHLRVVGLDIVPEHVTHAKCEAQKVGADNVEFYEGDAAQPPDQLKSRRFDLIFGIESLCHLDSDGRVQGFLQFAQKVLNPGGQIVVVDGFRADSFNSCPQEVQEAMILAESGFRICRMPSKRLWREVCDAAGLKLVRTTDLTHEAAKFWLKGWRVAQILLALPPFLLRRYFASSSIRAETGANFVAVVMTAYAFALGSASYGVLIFEKECQGFPS